MKSQSKERLPERVPLAATPAGETPSRPSELGARQWAHRSVWTDRMLETLLEDKVKGGKWHALSDWRVFKDFDGMIRRRLRRQLLKRHRRNSKRQCRTQRWPNTYFTERGFWSLREAHFRFAQSREGNY